jgi:hypothetical protein
MYGVEPNDDDLAVFLSTIRRWIEFYIIW